MHLGCSYDGTVLEKSKFEEFGARLRVSNEEEEEMKRIYFEYSERFHNRPEGVDGTDWDIHPWESVNEYIYYEMDRNRFPLWSVGLVVGHKVYLSA